MTQSNSNAHQSLNIPTIFCRRLDIRGINTYNHNNVNEDFKVFLLALHNFISTLFTVKPPLYKLTDAVIVKITELSSSGNQALYSQPSR